MASNLLQRKSAFWFHLGALLTVSAWGVSFISTKYLQSPQYGDLTPVEVYIARFVMAYLLMWVFCHKHLFANNLRDELLFALCGLCGGSIYYLAENTAIEYTTVSNVALITTTAPLLTAMLVGLLYKDERPGKGIIIGSLVAFTGVACVIFNSSFGGIQLNPLGDMLALAASIGWAIYSIVLRRLNALYDVQFISRKTFFYGILTALPFALLQSESHFCISNIFSKPIVWGNLLFLGVFASLFAYMIWTQAVRRLGPVKASIYLYFSPIVTLIASQIFLNEPITIIGGVGVVLILGGVWLGDWLSRSKTGATNDTTMH